METCAYCGNGDQGDHLRCEERALFVLKRTVAALERMVEKHRFERNVRIFGPEFGSDSSRVDADERGM